MKKSIIFLILSGIISNMTYSQCSNNNTYYVDATPSGVGVTKTISCVYAGEYCKVSVVQGAQYKFSTCGDTDFDTEITLYDNAGGSYLAYNDDACGTQSELTWTATFTGVVRVLIDEYHWLWGNCQHNSICMTLKVTQLTAPGGASVGLWTESGSNIYRLNGNVGIGTDTPEEKLVVNGNTTITGNLKVFCGFNMVNDTTEVQAPVLRTSRISLNENDSVIRIGDIHCIWIL